MHVSVLITGFAILIALESPTPWTVHTEDGDAYYKDTPNNQEEEAEITASTISQKDTAKGNYEQYGEGEADKKEWSVTDIINCLSTAVIAIFTVVLAVYTVRLFSSG